MRIKEGTIVWDRWDFDVHPDQAAIKAGEVADVVADWPVVEIERRGSGHVLPDGDWIFPGNTVISRITTT